MTREIIGQLASQDAALAIWEMKSLDVGPVHAHFHDLLHPLYSVQVMQQIAEMGVARAQFKWKRCREMCTHPHLDAMQESKKRYDPGFDPRSPPWAVPVPILPSTFATANSPSTPLREGLRSAAARTGTTLPSYKECSSSSVEGGEEVGEKRPLKDSDTSKYERSPSKKRNIRKADLIDEPYEPSPGARQEVNAQSFLQQVTLCFLAQIPILTAFYLHLDLGSGGAQQVHYNDSAFREP